MKVLFSFAVGLSIAFVGAGARADGRAACLDAASQGQTLRDAHRLLEARDEFRACAQQRCPAVVQKDCASWLDAVEHDLPTLVITTKDDRGADLVDVAVSIDGKPLGGKLDGQAVPANPGRHALHFEWAGGAPVDQAVVVREGEKNQAVAVVLPRASMGASSAGGQAKPGGLEAVGGPVHESPGSPWKTVGWALGAVGVVGLGIGTAFGVSAMGDKSDAHCINNVCQAGPLSRARSAALGADIGLFGGGALVAGGAGLILFGPSVGGSSTGVRLGPSVGLHGAGIAMGGTW